MGGTGSGRWNRYTPKPLVEDQVRINVHKWRKQNRLSDGNFFEWDLLEGKGTYWPAAVKVAAGVLEVTYQILDEEGHCELVSNSIKLGWTENLVGGHRVWFICSSCNLRVAHLYLSEKYLLCRHCYRLGYASQRNIKIGSNF